MNTISVEILQLASLLAKHGGNVPIVAFGGQGHAGALAYGLRQHLEAMGGPAPPPEKLQRRVVGAYTPLFVETGFQTINDLNAALAPNTGRTIGDFSHVLDFGVGCGRIIRRMAEAYPHMRRTGADIDAEAIDWLNAN